jgi:hypothetical protein
MTINGGHFLEQKNFYNAKIFANIYPEINKFLFHLATYRCLHSVIDSLAGYREFWVYTSDAHLEMAVISWCKIFGAYSNQTHWIHLFGGNAEIAEGIKETFHSQLQNEGVSISSYTKYHKSILKFRNNYVAHRSMNYKDPIPNFDLAMRVTYIFDRWVREQIKPDFIDMDQLENLYNKYKVDIEKTLECTFTPKVKNPL